LKGVVILGDSRVELRNVPKPEAKPGWALVRTKAAGICGSDLHFYHSTPEELRQGLRYGKVIGHEASGIVEEVGDGVTAVAPGDRVSIYHYVGCGHCHHCRAGYRQLCPERMGIAQAGSGAMAEYVLAPEENCLPLPDELSFVDGALMACAGATAYSALKKLGVCGNDDLVVFGLGPVGLSTVLEAKVLRARVIGVELISERIELARTLGADQVIDASKADPVDVIRNLTRGRGASLAIETSGSASGRAQIIKALCTRGKAAFVGLGSRGKVIDPSLLIDTEKVLMGSYVMPMGLYRPFAEFLVDRKVNLERIVTHRFSIDQAVEAFKVFDTRRTGKVVFEYR